MISTSTFESTFVTNTCDPETFLPARKQTVGESSLEKNEPDTILEKVKSEFVVHDWVSRVLTRPIRMFAEPMVLLTDLFLLYQYSVLFLYFEAYPIIFKGMEIHCASLRRARKLTDHYPGTYGMSSGAAACMLLPSKCSVWITLSKLTSRQSG